jgi:[acyl-carrier-protein] S-malonyltransferase
VGKLAFVFPGQGSAVVGMGDEIARVSPAARAVLDRLASSLPAIDRFRREGPKDALIRTAHAQPAIFAVDCACLAALTERQVRPDIVAGHSLGEYAALVAAGVVELEAGLALVARRGELMEMAAEARRGTMMASLGLDHDVVGNVVATFHGRGVIANANDNAPGQAVLSGDVETLALAGEALRERGARVIDLPVGGAFHSPLMAEAEEEFRADLEVMPFSEPRVPVISNTTAETGHDAATLKAALLGQITGNVRWRESVLRMLDLGVDRFVEVGPGKVLSGLIQRCARGRDVVVLNVEDGASLERTLRVLRPG